MVADQHGITRRAQHRSYSLGIGGVERCTTEVGEHERRTGHRWSVDLRSRPGHCRRKHARSRTHLALTVDFDPATRAELHPLWATLCHLFPLRRHRRHGAPGSVASGVPAQKRFMPRSRVAPVAVTAWHLRRRGRARPRADWIARSPAASPAHPGEVLGVHARHC